MLCYCLKPKCCVKWVRMHSISVIPFQYIPHFLLSNKQNFLEGNQASSVILGHVHGDEQIK